MSRSLKVVYENGVFRPLEPVPFMEHARLTLFVNEAVAGEEEWLDSEYHHYCETQADDLIAIEVVRKALAKIPGTISTDFIAERNER